LREMLAEWFSRELPPLIEREIKIRPSDSVVSLVGPRRSGKTCLLFQTAKELREMGYGERGIAYIDFEDLRLRGLTPDDFSTFVKVIHETLKEKDGRMVLLLDEVQMLKDWEGWVRTLHNSGRYLIVITGSSSKLSTAEVAASLRGRYLPKLVLPFSFREFLRFRGVDAESGGEAPEARGRVLQCLSDYMNFGGFPEVVKLDGEGSKTELLKVYMETIFYRDVVERFRVRDVSSLEYFSKALGECFGKPLSISKLEKTFRSMGIGKSKRTLSSYMRFFESAFFVFTVEKMGYKARERAQQPKKVYPLDMGMYRIHAGFSADLGRMMECTVAISLFRWRFAGGGEVYYWRDYQGREVDFVVKEGSRVARLIQVTYASKREGVEPREVEALIRASAELGCDDLLTITWDYEGEEDAGGGREVRFVPLWKWLLGWAGGVRPHHGSHEGWEKPTEGPCGSSFGTERHNTPITH